MKKKSNRAGIITVSICLTAVILLVGFIALADPLTGMIKFNEVKNGAKACEEIVISDPLREEAFLMGAEAVITGESARGLADDFVEVTKGANYKKALDASKGFWDIKLDFSADGQKYSVYLREDAVYVTTNKGYLFEIDRENQEKYYEFYAAVEKILDE